ncbi:MAG TPA: VIT1/CCC1 transporter family protein [Streptosporangiaceae bacterium]|nr:VIT1/CCC1 transporter family protein [Streptosporangiaceae bacterium]
MTAHSDGDQVDPGRIRRWRQLLASERDAAALYLRQAAAESGERSEILRELAGVERTHAAHWEGKLRQAGAPVPPPARTTILLAGVAGLLAGSFSMAAGEYVSMTSQREMYEREISLEAQELEENPEEERAELVLLYRAKGLSRSDAEYLTDKIMADKKVALDTLAREELGLDPTALGSPWSAAISSFAAFGSARSWWYCRT